MRFEIKEQMADLEVRAYLPIRLPVIRTSRVTALSLRGESLKTNDTLHINALVPSAITSDGFMKQCALLMKMSSFWRIVVLEHYHELNICMNSLDHSLMAVTAPSLRLHIRVDKLTST